MDLTNHFGHMATALFIGYKALTINETPVSCIMINTTTEEILSIGYNYTNTSLNGTQHAEFIAAKRLLDKGVNFKEITLYVTVEPCIMCASFLRQLGIGKVYYGCGNDRFGGNGTVLPVNLDKNLPDDVYPSFSGILRIEGIQLLRNFYIQENEAAPIPKVKKNKEIELKTYPENFFTVTEEEFVTEYGEERRSLFSQDRELTPKVGKGYKLRELVSLKELKKVPFLESELGVVDDGEMYDFLDLFYDIDEHGKVDYDREIKRYGQKRRASAELE